MITTLSILDYNYDLPDSSVAGYPLSERDRSKLLVWKQGEISDHHFSDLPCLLPEGAMLVFNNTRVIRARLLFVKATGAVIEVFCLEPTHPREYVQSFAQTSSCRWKCIVGNRKRWKGGQLQMQVAMETTRTSGPVDEGTSRTTVTTERRSDGEMERWRDGETE